MSVVAINLIPPKEIWNTENSDQFEQAGFITCQATLALMS